MELETNVHKGKHGRAIPFQPRKEGSSGIKITAKCANKACSSVKELRLTKFLPEDRVIEKLKQSGWSGQGHLQPGVPKHLLCPVCTERKAQKGKGETMPEITPANNGKGQDTLPLSQGNSPQKRQRIGVTVSLASTNSKSSQAIFRIPMNVWEAMGKPDRATVTNQNGSVALSFGKLGDYAVSKTASSEAVYVTTSKKKTPFRLPHHKRPMMPFFFEFDVTQKQLASEESIETFESVLGVKKQNTDKATFAPEVSPRSAPNRSEVADLRTAKDMLNQALRDVRSKGETVNVSVDSNGEVVLERVTTEKL